MDVLLITLVGTVAGTILAVEAQAWMPYVSRWLLKRTLAELPPELPEDLLARWREEIEADFQTYATRPLGGLWFALGLRRKGGRCLAAELTLQAALAQAVTALEVEGGKTMSITEAGREALRTAEGLEASLQAEAALLLLLGLGHASKGGEGS